MKLRQHIGTFIAKLTDNGTIREHVVKPLTRSPEWPKTRREHLKMEPVCQVCGAEHHLQVHHKQPFHLHPELELIQSNLITLCLPHHLLFGHLMYWPSWNADVTNNAAEYNVKIRHRP